jgi:uncharacterized protein (TIGR02996 family)
MSDPAAAFLRTIVADPDNDVPRLVYADWLDEHGQPERAEFIRVQIELARCPRTHRDYERLAERDRQLRAEWEEQWRKELPDLAGLNWCWFTRGFVEEIHAQLVVDRDRVPDLATARACTPLRRLHLSSILMDGLATLLDHDTLDWVRDFLLNVSGCVDSLLRWLSTPAAQKLERLRFSTQGCSPADVQRLLSAPQLARVPALEWTWFPPNESVVQHLAPLPALANLQALRVSWQGRADLSLHIGDLGVQMLAAVPSLPRLRELDLGSANLSPAGFAALARLPALRHLTTLELRVNRLVFESATALAAAEPLPNLVVLEVDDCTWTADAFRALAQAPGWATVRTLNLSNSQVDDAFASALADAPFWQLTRLDLTYTQLTAAGFQRLASARSCASLLSLNLGHCRSLNRVALVALFAANWPHLRHLNLAASLGTPDMMSAFASAPAGWRLHTLELRFNPAIGDAGVVALTRWPSLASVRYLDLRGCSIGATGARALLECPWLSPRLRLDVEANADIPADLLAQLRAKFRS